MWNGGLNQLDPRSGSLTHFGHAAADAASLSSDNVLAVIAGRDGTLWAGTADGGLNHLDPRSGSITHFRHEPANAASLASDVVQALYEDDDGTLWVGTARGLDHLDPRTGSVTHFRHDAAEPSSLSSDNVTALHQDRLGRLWIGTAGGGLNLLDRATGAVLRWQHDPSNQRSLPDNTIMALYEDRSGVLWIATEGAGVAYVDLYHTDFVQYAARPTDPAHLSASIVRGLAVDQDGIAWVGTFGGGLNRFDPRTRRFVRYRNDPANPGSLSDDQIWTVYVDPANVVWVGTERGFINRFDRATGSFTRTHLAQVDGATFPVRVFYEDRAGAFWVGSDGGGLSRFDRTTGTFTTYRHDPADPHSLSENFVSVLYEDRAGSLWVGTARGLNRLDRAQGTFTRYHHIQDDPHSLSRDAVTSLAETPDGGLWVGTFGGGLNRLDRASGTFRHYLERDGLISNLVQGITYVGDELWISTGRGLSHFDVQTEAFRNYDTADGLPEGGFSMGSLAHTAQGMLYAGGFGGLVVFDPAAMGEDSFTPPLAFTDLRIDNQPVPISDDGLLKQAINETEALVLPPEARNLSIEIATLDYRAPERLRYRYRLEGFDTSWNEVGSGQRFISYANLPAGTYELRVMGTNHVGRWSETGRSMTVTITPFWWETLWFRTLLIGSLAGLAAAGYWRRIANLRAQQRRLEHQVAERTDQLEHTNARLATEIVEHEQTEAEARQARDELATLLTISQSIVAMLDLEPLLDRVLEQLGRIIAYDAAFVGTLDGQTLTIRAFRSRVPRRVLRATQLDTTRIPPLHTLITTREPFVIADLQTDTAMVAYIEGAIDERVANRAWMGVPLVVQDRVIGVMNMLHAQADCYSAADLQRVQAFATQVALALENARLYERAREAATLEERNRLARDLHDAVTQTLFSASLVAEALPKAWQAAPPLAVRGVEHVRLLTRGALAEMRTLLLELRPQTLTEKPLGELLQALSTATASRSQVPVEVDVAGTYGLPPEVQIALYRIAQESLNNVVKHAEASRVRITLLYREAAVVLAVADDGRGFPTATVAPDSFGLGIMRERAAAIGARLRIRSCPGHGTILAVRWTPPRAGAPTYSGGLNSAAYSVTGWRLWEALDFGSIVSTTAIKYALLSSSISFGSYSE